MVNLGNGLRACEYKCILFFLDGVCCKCHLRQVGWLHFHISCLGKFKVITKPYTALYIFFSYSHINFYYITIIIQLYYNTITIIPVPQANLLFFAYSKELNFHTWAFAFVIFSPEMFFPQGMAKSILYKNISGLFSNMI